MITLSDPKDLTKILSELAKELAKIPWNLWGLQMKILKDPHQDLWRSFEDFHSADKFHFNSTLQATLSQYLFKWFDYITSFYFIDTMF